MAKESKDTLQAIHRNIQRLVTYCDSLESKLAKQQEVLNTHQQTIASLEEELEATQQKYQNLKLARGISYEMSDTQAAKDRFNKLVREIDKCISLLNE